MTYYSQHAKVWVSVDCIIFGFDEGKLRVLIGRRHMDPGRGEWSLYGGFVDAEEGINEAAARTLEELTGLNNLYMRQVGAFGSVDRDPGERVISIAYFTLTRVQDVRGGDDAHVAKWFPINQLPELAFDHQEMFNLALQRLSDYLKLKTGNFFSGDFSYEEIDMIYFATLTNR